MIAQKVAVVDVLEMPIMRSTIGDHLSGVKGTFPSPRHEIERMAGKVK